MRNIEAIFKIGLVLMGLMAQGCAKKRTYGQGFYDGANAALNQAAEYCSTASNPEQIKKRIQGLRDEFKIERYDYHVDE